MVGVGAFVAGELLSDALAGRVGGAGGVSGVVQRVAQVWMEEAAACRGAVSEGEGGLVRMTATYLDLVLPRAKANSSPGSTEGASGVAVAVLMRACWRRSSFGAENETAASLTASNLALLPVQCFAAELRTRGTSAAVQSNDSAPVPSFLLLSPVLSADFLTFGERGG